MDTSLVYRIDHAAVPNDPVRPQVLWAAPGSLFVEDVERTWIRRGCLDDLAEVAGPWAVVLWDPGRREQVIVGDPVGVQPLYWAPVAGALAVSSSLPAIADYPGVDDSMSVDGVLLHELRLHLEELQNHTGLVGVQRVGWGQAVRVAADGTSRLVRYWDPRWVPGPDESLTLADCAELLRERIDAAVRRLIPATDVGVGGHVSSGIDCTTMTVRANQVLRENGRPGVIAGYSWSPNYGMVPRLPSDERDLIEAVTRQEGFPVRLRPDGDPGDWLYELDPVRYPSNTTALERHSLVQAREDGVAVMFSGWGGDELASFNGRMTLEARAAEGHLWQVWSESKARVRLRYDASGPMLQVRGVRSTGAFLRDGLRARYRSRRAKPGEQRRSAAEQLRTLSPTVAELYLEAPSRIAQARDGHEYQLALFTGGHMQRRTESWFHVGGVMGVSYRYPLLDLGVVQAALSLPWWAYRDQGWNRVAYRKAVADWIPAQVAWNIPKSEPSMVAGRGDGGSLAPGESNPEYAELVATVRRIVQPQPSLGRDPSRLGLRIRSDSLPS